MKLRVLLVGLLVAAGCSDLRTELVPAPAVSPNGGRDADRDAGQDAGAAPSDASPPGACGNKPCKCANEKDDDKDGLIDSLDPECTSPFDDDEGFFATGMKGPLNECEDCFWDDNDSASDDGCAYPAKCRAEGASSMPGPPAMTPPGAMMCRSCDVEQRCIDTCRSQTPNGCDCFGCCAITGEGGVAVNVVLGDECAVTHVGDEKRCPRCVPNPQCFNPCGPCEQCFGKSPEDVPAECEDASISACEDGYQSCNGDIACPDGFYCVLGCCMVTVF